MKKFELKRATAEVKNLEDVKRGCTLKGIDVNDEVIESFENETTALEELKEYKSTARKIKGYGWNNTYYDVTEYYIEENSYDEDGEWLEGGDISMFSNIEILG